VIRPLQRHHATVADGLDMGVDQPRQHGRIAVVEHFTSGGAADTPPAQPRYATVLDEHGGTAGPDFTIGGMVCTDREHTAWLPKPTRAYQRASRVEPA
jgi:hypothetical protein